MKKPNSCRARIFRVCAATLFFCLIRVASADEQQTQSWTLANTVRSFDPALAESTKAGSQFWFVNKQDLNGRTLKLSIVAPGKATHPPHTHAEDEFFFILEGSAEFYLNGTTTSVGPLTSLYCPPHSMHGIRNNGDTDLKYLVIKKYILDDGQ